ncbi:TPA: hypothetical protein VJR00_001844, partial [Streptococcus pyogenes]|nr:hypothetical protein [Streptococcus pyogenes]
MIIKWFGHLGTLASLIGIIFVLNSMKEPPFILMGFLICLSIVLFTLSVVYEFKTTKKKGLYCDNEKEINDYMI